jgi:hypothetical protein
MISHCVRPFCKMLGSLGHLAACPKVLRRCLLCALRAKLCPTWNLESTVGAYMFRFQSAKEDLARSVIKMPYKDPEAKRRYMARYYEQKIKTGAIPCTRRCGGLKEIKTLSQSSIKSAVLDPVKPHRINEPYPRITSSSDVLRPAQMLRPEVSSPAVAQPVAKSYKPARSPQFKTALDLFRPFPVGMPASRVCPFCNNTRFSSPGTPCSYCR